MQPEARLHADYTDADREQWELAHTAEVKEGVDKRSEEHWQRNRQLHPAVTEDRIDTDKLTRSGVRISELWCSSALWASSTLNRSRLVSKLTATLSIVWRWRESNSAPASEMAGQTVFRWGCLTLCGGLHEPESTSKAGDDSWQAVESGAGWPSSCGLPGGQDCVRVGRRVWDHKADGERPPEEGRHADAEPGRIRAGYGGETSRA